AERPPVRREEPAERQRPPVVADLLERDRRVVVRRLVLQDAVDPGLELRGDPGEGQVARTPAGGSAEHGTATTAAHATATTPGHQMPPIAVFRSGPPERCRTAIRLPISSRAAA